MDDLRERVAAVERALTDGEGDLSGLAEGAATAERVTDLEAAIDALREDVTEIEAATQALRGYVGNVRSINEDVEQRADAALAAVEDVTDRVDSLEEQLGTGATRPAETDGEQALSDVTAAGDASPRTGPPNDPGASDGTSPAGRDESPASGGPTVDHSSLRPSGGERDRVVEERDDLGRRDAGHDPGASRHGQPCPACGRGPGETAADGGQTADREDGANGGRATARDHATGDRAVAEPPESAPASATRSDVAGFDPERPPEVVQLGRADDSASPADRGVDRSGAGPRGRSGGGGPAGTTDDDATGLLARARELL